MTFKKALPTFFLVVAIFASFGLGFWLGESQVVCPICSPEDIDFSLFWETWKTIEERYVDKEKLNIQEMIYGAISGMVKSLEDPYTIFLTPGETKRFVEDVEGFFEGVGMEIGIRGGQLQVIAPLEGTPAQRAGLRAGDKILKIDDKATLDITIEEAVSLIRGQKGTEVTLNVFREEWEKPKDFEIIRQVIEVPSLRWEIKDGNIAYIKIYHFTEKAGFDFSQAAMEILASPAEKIILDLRNNPGGYLHVAKNIAGWFLEKGQILVIEEMREERIPAENPATGKLSTYPTLILINQGTASGAEILAGALRDNRDILLIGEKTFGKGSVQELAKLRESSSLKITIARWLTPKGESITDKGLEPDIEVEMTEEDYEKERDPQLDKALEIIKGLE